MKFKRVLQVFLTFVKIGLFTFGGGHAMIPLIEREIVDNHGWINKQDVNDVIAVCESVPGSIAVNSATFVGYKVAGFWGALFATLGVIIPSFTIILIITGLLRQFSELRAVRYAFAGIRAGVLALLFNALVSMYRQSPRGIVYYIIMAAAFLVTAFVNGSAIYIILGAVLTGLIMAFIADRRARGGESR